MLWLKTGPFQVIYKINVITDENGLKPNNNILMYSFSSDPIDSVIHGTTHNGTHRFLGNKQLQIQWDDTMYNNSNETYQIDIYAYVQSVIECSATYVKKATL